MSANAIGSPRVRILNVGENPISAKSSLDMKKCNYCGSPSSDIVDECARCGTDEFSPLPTNSASVCADSVDGQKPKITLAVKNFVHTEVDPIRISAPAFIFVLVFTTLVQILSLPVMTTDINRVRGAHIVAAYPLFGNRVGQLENAHFWPERFLGETVLAIMFALLTSMTRVSKTREHFQIIHSFVVFVVIAAIAISATPVTDYAVRFEPTLHHVEYTKWVPLFSRDDMQIPLITRFVLICGAAVAGLYGRLVASGGTKTHSEAKDGLDGVSL